MLCVIIIHKNGKIRISLRGNAVKAVVFLKNNGAQKEMVTTTNGSERVNLVFKVIRQGFKNDFLKRSAEEPVTQ